jgi:hypothetical protein
MPYAAQTWVDGNVSYPLSAARMGVIESGLVAAAAAADQGHRVMTTATRDGLSGVVTGTMIYNTTLSVLQVWNGAAWKTAAQSTVVPMCQMVVTPSLSIATTAADQTVTSASFAIDTDTMGGTANRITITTAGVYAVSYSLIYNGNATGYRASTVAVNGVGGAIAQTGHGQIQTFGTAGFQTTMTITKLVSLASADYLTLVTAQSSGGALALGAQNMYLQAQYVSRIV